MLFKNILVPWDGSKHSNHAFKIALNIAKKYDSKINLVSCLCHADTGAGYLDSSINKDIFKTAKDTMINKMSDLKNDAKKVGISTSTDVLITDSTVKQIVIFAKANKIDLVVMGSHGLTGWKKLLLGSVASGVSQQVHCPVLIVR
jgi:nucleotide-binding universal stress UspA family protein